MGFSWVWVVLASGVAVMLYMGMWIVLEETQGQLHPSAVNSGVNISNLTTFETFLKISPFVLLASWAITVWTTAAATQGGDAI